MISKEEEIFNELVDERLEKITDLDKNFNSDDLIYRCKSKPADVKFDEFDNDFDIIDEIRDSKIELADVTNNQEKFKSYLKKNEKRKEKHKSIKHFIEMLYKARNEAI